MCLSCTASPIGYGRPWRRHRVSFHKCKQLGAYLKMLISYYVSTICTNHSRHPISLQFKKTHSQQYDIDDISRSTELKINSRSLDCHHCHKWDPSAWPHMSTPLQCTSSNSSCPLGMCAFPCSSIIYNPEKRRYCHIVISLANWYSVYVYLSLM